MDGAARSNPPVFAPQEKHYLAIVLPLYKLHKYSDGFAFLRKSHLAALTVHRTVIHSRDCASLTLYTRGPLRSGQNRITHLRVMRGTENYTRIERSLALGVRENRWMDSHRIRAPRAAHRAKTRSMLWAPQSWQIKPAVEEDTSPPMAVAEAK